MECLRWSKRLLAVVVESRILPVAGTSKFVHLHLRMINNVTMWVIIAIGSYQ